MADALTNPAADEAFALFCEQGSAALALAGLLATRRFLSSYDAIVAACSEPVRPSAPRIYTGYMPEAARRNFRHRTYCDGLRTPRDRTARDMAAMGLGR